MLTVQCALRAAPGNWIRVGLEATLVGLELGLGLGFGDPYSG